MAEGWAMDGMEDGITLRPKWEMRVNLLPCPMPSDFCGRHSLQSEDNTVSHPQPNDWYP